MYNLDEEADNDLRAKPITLLAPISRVTAVAARYLVRETGTR